MDERGLARRAAPHPGRPPVRPPPGVPAHRRPPRRGRRPGERDAGTPFGHERVPPVNARSNQEEALAHPHRRPAAAPAPPGRLARPGTPPDRPGAGPAPAPARVPRRPPRLGGGGERGVRPPGRHRGAHPGPGQGTGGHDGPVPGGPAGRSSLLDQGDRRPREPRGVRAARCPPRRRVPRSTLPRGSIFGVVTVAFSTSTPGGGGGRPGAAGGYRVHPRDPHRPDEVAVLLGDAVIPEPRCGRARTRARHRGHPRPGGALPPAHRARRRDGRLAPLPGNPGSPLARPRIG